MDKILEKWIIVDNCSKDVLQIPINPFVGSWMQLVYIIYAKEVMKMDCEE
jgi:hypothetical protein